MWTRETRSPFSTEAVLPSTWPLEQYAPKLVASLHGCQEKAVAGVIAAHAKHHADEAWLDSTLGRLSAPALAVLERLAAHGGFLHLHDLVEGLEDAYGFGPDEVKAAIDECLPPLLVAPLESPRGSAAALVASAADRVAIRVAGLGERSTPTGPLRTLPGDDGRALLAIAAWLGQLDLKLTQSYEPHRAGVKRIAKQLGVTEAIVEARVRTAWRLGLLRESEDGLVRPDAEALANAATGRFSRHREIDAIVVRLRELGRPLSVAAIDRWSAACVMRGAQHAIAADLAHLPGLVLEVDETREPSKPARRAPARGRGDLRDDDDELAEKRYVRAHPIPDEVAITITPSFELFIAPEARLAHLVAVVPLCEPVRLDRVIVGRLTKASVQRAASFGRTADEMLAGLSAASKTPLPANVAAAIRDWTTSSTIAVTTTGRVIVVPAELQDRLVAILPPIAAARVLAPGVIVCSLELTERAVNIAFEKLSLVTRRDTAALLPHPIPDTKVPLPGLLTAPDTLRARLARYRAGDPKERAGIEHAIQLARSRQRPAIPPGRAAPSKPSPLSGRWGGDDAYAEYDDDDDDDDDIGGEWERAWDEAPPALHRLVSRFEQRLGTELSIRQYGALIFALNQIAPPERSFVLEERELAGAVARLRTVVAARLARRGDNADLLHKALEALGAATPELAGAPGPTPALEWQRTDLLARIAAAERVHARLFLDVGDRQVRVHLRKVVPRGNTLMVLGDDPDGIGVAFPIEAIHGIADDPGPSADATAPTRSARWVPIPGMSAPGGHTDCPCGSGKRYRQCCRDAPS